jgi:2-hydroxychromene-2-carboxylate isomerase
MSKIVDYYFSPNSPWAYFGHERFVAIAKRAGAHINVKPVDYGRIFPQSGGVPVAQRAKQRQAYRMMELKRWRAHLGIPINFTPKFAGSSGVAAARLIIAADMKELNAMALAGFVGKAVWEEERDIADPVTLQTIAAEHGRNAKLLWDTAQSQATQDAYDAYTAEAIERGVFGAPTYVYKDELFWGQDRLEFLERALALS